jgi:uncharacterized protein (PEP-CTERM system associated)
VSGGAIAGDWTLTESTAFTGTSVDRDGNNSYSGLVLQASPSINFVGESGRSWANVNYQPTFSVGSGSTDPEFLTHNLVARGRLEAVEDVFFLGANAGAQLYGDSNYASGVDAINVNADGGQSYSFGLTPEFRFRLNRYANIVSQNSINYVGYTGDNVSGNSDSWQGRLHLGVRSGRDFGRFDWRADASYLTTKYETRTDDRSELSGGLGYRFTPQFRVNASVGFENNDVVTNRSDTDGLFWDTSALWSPGPRTSVRANFGERYFGQRYGLDWQHLSRRTQFSLGFDRDVDNRRSEQLVDSFFYVRDTGANLELVPVTDNFVDDGSFVRDVGTGQLLSLSVPTQRQIDEDYITERLRAAVVVNGRRTTFSMAGAVASRDYEVTNANEDSYDLQLALNRRMGNRFVASLSGNYQFLKDTGFGDSDYYDLRITLTRPIGRESGASLTISHHERDADNSLQSYEENRIGLSFYTGFL